MHYMPLHGTKVSVHQIVSKTKSSFAKRKLFSKTFDAYVPFMQLGDAAAKSIVQHELGRFGMDDENEELVDEVMAGVYEKGSFVQSVHTFLIGPSKDESADASSSSAPKPTKKRPLANEVIGHPLLARQQNKKPKSQEINSHSHNITLTNSHNPNSHNPSNSHNSNSLNPTAKKGANRDATKSFNKTSSHIPVAPQMATTAKYPPATSEGEEEEIEEVERNQPFPIRKNINVKPFVDGKDYYSDLCDAIKKAQHELLICGWQLGNIFLLRPTTEQANLDSNMFSLLGNAAARGVTIYIMLREHDGKMIANDHNWYKSTLEKSYPDRVKVSLQRKGMSVKIGGVQMVPAPSIWSHHQKFVVIDRQLAYIGGLDLTYNRWDTPEHKVVEEESIIPDNDYYHSGFAWKTDRLLHPRMGWHDVQLSVDGLIAEDLRTSFCQRWNTVETDCKIPYTLQFPTKTIPKFPGTSPSVQVVRSISGLEEGKKEASINLSYCALIASAPTFVCIL
eukprot:Phypoly_transcript_02084.p1 GENE.Phypoly_transcript_02084~~Phypoly_transcript_02084.p1  ORF type:complete len:505 (+),score=78.42 Phypoly_transcript_02084:585-2099(+)